VDTHPHTPPGCTVCPVKTDAMWPLTQRGCHDASPADVLRQHSGRATPTEPPVSPRTQHQEQRTQSHWSSSILVGQVLEAHYSCHIRNSDVHSTAHPHPRSPLPPSLTEPPSMARSTRSSTASMMSRRTESAPRVPVRNGDGIQVEGRKSEWVDRGCIIRWDA
jgi:hypothetical protein